MANYIRQHNDAHPDLNYRDFVAVAWGKARQRGPLPAFEKAEETIDAYINYGRWIAECPMGDGCAFVVSKDQPYFICTVNAHGPYKVRFPRNANAIEDELRKRPENNQNWVKGETVGDLRVENERHGVA